MNKPNISTKDWELLNDRYGSNINIALEKLNNGYPLQYLIGDVEFLDSRITVDERVLIPRYETEYLVHLVIEYAKKNFKKKLSIIDLATGSGCIAIALKKALNADVIAIDISSRALEVAKQNALINKVNIKFKKQDILESLTKNYDLIITNPPYIPENGYVAPNVLKYEPHLALFAPENGTYFIKEVINRHLNNLNKPGLMAIEIGDNQEEILVNFLKNIPNIKYELKKDLTNRPRYLFIYNE